MLQKAREGCSHRLKYGASSPGGKPSELEFHASPRGSNEEVC